MNLLIPSLRALSEVLTAAVAMTAFSVLLFSLRFLRRKQRLAIALVPLLVSVTAIYSADALETMAVGREAKLIWQMIHWTGFIILPAGSLAFSIVLLDMTGKTISRWLRGFTFVNILLSFVFIGLLWKGRLFDGIRIITNIGTTMIHNGMTFRFWIYFAVNLSAVVWILGTAFSRTRTQTSRRRMIYLIVGLLGIVIGTFPLLLFGSGMLISQYPLVFWTLSVIGNALVTLMVLLLGYAVATFSVSWSDRLTRLRLIEWILRGPVTASLTLWLVTMINRMGGILGLNIDGLSTLATVVAIILLEYFVSVLVPWIEQGSLVGLGPEDYAIFREFQGMMIFKPELVTYLEALTGALCDRFQARDGFFAVADESGAFEPVIRTGDCSWQDLDSELRRFPAYFCENNYEPYRDETGIMIPVFNHDEQMDTFLGVLGLADAPADLMTNGYLTVLEDALDKARTVLWQRRYLTAAWRVLRSQTAEPENAPFRTGSVLDQGSLLAESGSAEPDEVSVWVKDALTHYWGGPKLSENPLLQWKIVKMAAEEAGDNDVNGLRAVLKKALEELRPEGERTTGGEWMLYNLIDYKFFEKQKVRDIVRRLSMSEADFYRKQKVAVESLAKVIVRMENAAHE